MAVIIKDPMIPAINNPADIKVLKRKIRIPL
jgi:hypothetical protein